MKTVGNNKGSNVSLKIFSLEKETTTKTNNETKKYRK